MTPCYDIEAVVHEVIEEAELVEKGMHISNF
jgi:hypothetical protein